MSNLRLAMDAAFWDLSVPSAQTLDGSARWVPGDFFPITAGSGGRSPRSLQLCFLGNRFPLIPIISPTEHKELGPFALQSILLKHVSKKWWVGSVGQVRPKTLIASLKAEVAAIEDFDLQAIKDIMKHFINKSLYALGLCMQVFPTRNSALHYSVEGHGDKGRRSKAAYLHKLRHHDFMLQAAWPELFIDKKGSYWDVPASISLDLASVSLFGLRYRIGIHKSNGDPKPLSQTCGDVPLALMPGLYAKAAFSYKKTLDLWRKTWTIESTNGQLFGNYDIRLGEPHASISGIIGGTYTARLSGSSGDGNFPNRFVDWFGSVCFSLQHGRFKKVFGDLTRIDARLDICSGKAYTKGKTEANPLATPQLNVIFHQQILGGLVFRIDSRIDSSSYSPSEKLIPHADDIVYSLCYAVPRMHSGKIVAWYSPERKEGMIELRVFEFERL